MYMFEKIKFTSKIAAIYADTERMRVKEKERETDGWREVERAIANNTVRLLRIIRVFRLALILFSSYVLFFFFFFV